MAEKSRVQSSIEDVRRMMAIVAVVATVVGVLLFHVWNQYRITRLGYQIAEVTHEHRRLMEENKKLTIEAAVQGRTDRMTALASQRFGLQPARPSQIREISLREADVDGEPPAHAVLDID